MTSAEAILPGGRGGEEMLLPLSRPAAAAGASSGRVSEKDRRALGQHSPSADSTAGQGAEKCASPFVALSAANF